MALQPFPEVLKDPRFQELPPERKQQVAEDYWVGYSNENPAASTYALEQMKGSKDLLKVRADKETADPITKRVLDYQDEILSSRLTFADANENKLFRNPAERDRVLKGETDRLETHRKDIDELLKTHESNIAEGTKRESVTGFIGGGSAKSLAGFNEGAYQSAKDALNDWGDVSDGVSEALLQSGGDIDKALNWTRGRAADDERAHTSAMMGAASSGASPAAMAGISASAANSQKYVGAATRLQDLKAAMDAQGIPEADRPKVLKDAALSTAWTEKTEDNVRKLSNGELAINPGRVFGSPEALVAEIDKTDTSKGNKELAKIKLGQMRERMAGKMFQNAVMMDIGNSDQGSFEKFANAKLKAGETDKAKILDDWSAQQKDRSWIFKAPDAIWEGIKTGEVGIAKTVIGTSAGVASLWGGGQGLAQTQQALGEVVDRSTKAADLRGVNEGGFGITKDLSNTITQMAPMFAGGGLAAGMEGLSAAALRGASVYGWAAAQGYESKLADAVTLAEQKAGRQLSPDELTKVLGSRDTQLSAFANAAQTAALSKILGGGAEAAALGKAAEGMTVRQFLSAGGRAALKDGTLRTELKAVGKNILKDFSDEALEESLNQTLDKAISIGGLGDTLKMGDLLEESLYAGLLGGVAGGALGQLRTGDHVVETAPMSDEELKRAANAALIREATTPLVAANGELTAGATRRAEIAAAPESVVPAAPVVAPPAGTSVAALKEATTANYTRINDQTSTPETNEPTRTTGPDNEPADPQLAVQVPSVPTQESGTAVEELQGGTDNGNVTTPSSETPEVTPLAEPPQSNTTPKTNVQEESSGSQKAGPTSEGGQEDNRQKEVAAKPEPPKAEAPAPFTKGQTVDITMEDGSVERGKIEEVTSGGYGVVGPDGSLMQKSAEELAPVAEQTSPSKPVVDQKTPQTKVKRTVTAADLKSAEKLADRVTKGQPTSVRDAALDAITNQLRKDPDTPPALLTTIAKRAAGKRGVKTAEREALSAGNVGTTDTGLAETLADAAAAPDEQAAAADEATDRQAKLDAAVKTLSPSQQKVMAGVRAGKTNAEIAAETGTTENTVANLKSRAMAKLREQLKLPSGPPTPFHEPTAPTPTKAEAAKSDQDLLNDFAGVIAKPRNVSPEAVTSKITVSAKPLTKEQKVAKKIGEFFGRRVVFLSGVKPNGINARAMPGVIFISDKANRASTMVAYHELLHSLAATDPKAYEKLKAAVKVDLDAYVKARPTRAGTAESTNEEFLADFMADRASDPAFWEQLAKKDRPLFDKIVALLQSIIKSVTAGRFGTEQFVSDLAAADAALHEALLTLRLQGDVSGRTGKETDVKNEAGADAEYLAAVETGDTETAQRMVNEAAKAAGIPPNRVFRADANSDFTVFDLAKAGERSRNAISKMGFFFSGKPGFVDNAAYTGGGKNRTPRRMYIDLKNPYLIMEGKGVFELEDGLYKQLEKALDLRGLSTSETAKKIKDYLVSQGHDGIRFAGDYNHAAHELVVFSPSQIKSDDPVTYDAEGNVIPLSERFNPESDDIRFEEPEGKKRNPVQTAGYNNPFFDRPDSHGKVLDRQVAEEFDWKTHPTTEAGAKDAVRFLLTASDPKLLKEAMNKAEAQGVPRENSITIAGKIRASVTSYLSRLVKDDRKLGLKLMAQVQLSAKSFGFLDIPTNDAGLYNISEIARALGSVKAYEGGSIIGLFDQGDNARGEFTTGELGKEAIPGAKKISNTDISKTSADDIAREIEADVESIPKAIDPVEAERIAKAESAARAAWDRTIDLLGQIFDARQAGLKPELPEGESFEDAFARLRSYKGNKDVSLEDISKLFDQLEPLFESELGLPGKSAIDDAKKKTAKASKAKEAATGTTTTTNQLDILGKRRIGQVTRATNEDTEAQAKLKDDFKALMVSGKSMSDFVKVYVALGGTEEVGTDLFHANEAIIERQQDRQIDTELRQAKAVSERAQKNAEDRFDGAIDTAQKFVDKWGDKVEPKRPTDANDTPSKALTRFVNTPVTEEQLTQQLSEFQNKDGQPTFTEEQVGALVTKAAWAKEAKVESKSEAKRESAEKQIADREVRAKKRRKAAIDRAQAFVDKVGDKAEPRRPTTVNNTPAKTISRYMNTKKARVPQAAFEDQLRAFKNKDGQPTFTEDQVQEIVARADMAREDQVAADELKALAKATKTPSFFELGAKADRLVAGKEPGARSVDEGSLSSFINNPEQKKPANKRTVREIILEDFINNPERKVLNQQERIEFAEDIIREQMPEVPADQVHGLALRIEGQLAKRLEQEKFKAAEGFLQSLSGGKTITRDKMHQAIRLEILDPTKDFVSSIAALAGWDGLTPNESIELTRLQYEIDHAGPNSKTRMRNGDAQLRIIKSAVGIPPGFGARYNAYLTASVYSGTRSFGAGYFSGVSTMVGQLGMETGVSLWRSIRSGNPSLFFEEMGVYQKSWRANLHRGVDEWIDVFKTGSTFTAQIKAGQEVDFGEGYVDPITRDYDSSVKRLKSATLALQTETDPKKRTKAMKSRFANAFIAYVPSQLRFVFRSLSAVDSAVAKQVSATQTMLLAYRRARDMGITKTTFDALMADAKTVGLTHGDYLQTTLGWADASRILQTEVRDATELALLQALAEKGVDTLNLQTEATLDTQSKLGTAASSHDLPGIAAEGLSKFRGYLESKNIPAAGVLLAVRTPANVASELLWSLPGYNVPRAVKLLTQSPEKIQETFPNIRSEWQKDRRLALVAASYILPAAFAAGFLANLGLDDEDKWFWFTQGEPPYGSEEWLKWQRLGWLKNSLILGNWVIPLDRSFAQALLPWAMAGRIICDLADGTSTEELSKELNWVAQVFIPGVDQVDSLSRTLKNGGLPGLAKQQLSLAIPSLAKTVRRAQPKIDEKASNASLWDLNPFYVVIGAEGVVQATNVLGEPLAMDESPWGAFAKTGVLPFFVKVEGKRDPRKVKIFEDFAKNNYGGGGYSVAQFKARLEKSKTGKPFSYDLYHHWRDAYISDFVDRYNLDADEKDYNRHVGNQLERSRDRADRQVGL